MEFRERKRHWALGKKGNLGQRGEEIFPKGCCGPTCVACWPILHKKLATWISAVKYQGLTALLKEALGFVFPEQKCHLDLKHNK